MHRCPKCGREFTRKYTRDLHFKRVHDEGFLPSQTTFICPFCHSEGILNHFSRREDLTNHIDEEHAGGLAYKLKKEAFDGKVQIYVRPLASLQPLDHFINDKQNRRDIAQVILQNLNKTPVVRVSLIVTAYYQIQEVSDDNNRSVQERDSFTLRTKASLFSRYDKSRGFHNRVRFLLNSLLKREEDLLMRGSGWNFESLDTCEIEIFQIRSIN